MKTKELTDRECMDIFRKYDPKLAEFYQMHGENFGIQSRMYAKFLLERNESKANEVTKAALAEYDEMKNHPGKYQRYESFGALAEEVLADS